MAFDFKISNKKKKLNLSTSENLTVSDRHLQLKGEKGGSQIEKYTHCLRRKTTEELSKQQYSTSIFDTLFV